MKSTVDILEERVSAAMAKATGQAGCAAVLRPATDPRFGDYQANGVMALAKQIKTNPRKLAETVVAQLDVSDLCEPPEVAGPGFINLRLKPGYLAGELIRIAKEDGERLGIRAAASPQTVVVDFSSPNIAKEMHVGHLRSTIIGDCLCRLLEFEGHRVIRQNHIGDWGTQFGRVILGLWHMCMAEKHGDPHYYRTEFDELRRLAKSHEDLKGLCQRIRDRHEQDWGSDPTGERSFVPFLEGLGSRDVERLWEQFLCVYQYVNALEEAVTGSGLTIRTINRNQEENIPYESLSRRITVMLQRQDRQELDAWQFIRKLTLEHCGGIYEKLSVGLTMADVRGESFYKDKLPAVVSDLQKSGLAVTSDGAVCVFPPGFQTKEGEPLPFIIQKSDGAFLYATTDLAALRYRINVLKADRIVYVTDARQIQHFQMLFKVAEMAGWDQRDGRKIDLVHVTFGSVLGEDGKPLKTRSGENVKLKELLDEAVERAKGVVEEKNPELSAKAKSQIAQAVGIGAVKYADYSNSRTSDYVFSFDKMLAMEGNTAPYMQYAYARVRSIERKAQTKGVDVASELASVKTLNLSEPSELDLAKHLVRYTEAVESAIADYRPNYLTAYLYELAQRFSAFYTNCPVLDAPRASRPTRLLLCGQTARTIGHGLNQLLGIAVVEQM
ncbi:MAG TPA: arginine--tRNA ligase [Sedimentisphaerales bacterium]|jgi:arginyl-tRNA synthetase|nr:arginine--tRNA ligase [Sedimentisphaerales bacterium]HNU30017.1 arginine--tRNA ligase [Sedimentisphaerales bacterium]